MDASQKGEDGGEKEEKFPSSKVVVISLVKNLDFVRLNFCFTSK